jgi:metal-responsive CopG/Arc/MetJ family transcriptional regulator
VIGLRLPAQLVAALENWAKKNRLSRSEAVRRAIEQMLASEGKSKR